MSPSPAGQNSMWTAGWRALVFCLAGTSIWCLLAEFYGICSMRTFTFFFSLPALLVLLGLAGYDWYKGGERTLWNRFWLGSVAGFLATVTYDVFRLPFVFSQELGTEGFIPALKLFKVFPRFGAMILGQPLEQGSYSLAAHLVGWAYHFSNGITFGVMYLAAVGNPRVRSWWWAVVMAAGLEFAMLFTPYPGTFGISVTAVFVVVTLSAHMIFGVTMGLSAKALQNHYLSLLRLERE